MVTLTLKLTPNFCQSLYLGLKNSSLWMKQLKITEFRF